MISRDRSAHSSTSSDTRRGEMATPFVNHLCPWTGLHPVFSCIATGLSPIRRMVLFLASWARPHCWFRWPHAFAVTDRCRSQSTPTTASVALQFVQAEPLSRSDDVCACSDRARAGLGLDDQAEEHSPTRLLDDIRTLPSGPENTPSLLDRPWQLQLQLISYL